MWEAHHQHLLREELEGWRAAQRDAVAEAEEAEWVDLMASGPEAHSCDPEVLEFV